MTEHTVLQVAERPTTVASPQARHPVRLLHVEDNPVDAALVQAYFQQGDSEAIFDTVTRLSDITPERAASNDCAILDLTLPDASGLEALVALRGMSPDLPIIVLTGFDDVSLRLTALDSGAEDYLVKSQVDSHTLQRAIRDAVERRKLAIALIELAAREHEDAALKDSSR